jgi:hypothetical protein
MLADCSNWQANVGAGRGGVRSLQDMLVSAKGVFNNSLEVSSRLQTVGKAQGCWLKGA